MFTAVTYVCLHSQSQAAGASLPYEISKIRNSILKLMISVLVRKHGFGLVFPSLTACYITDIGTNHLKHPWNSLPFYKGFA